MDREVIIFEQALAIALAEGRDAYLREACAGDDRMLERIQALLRAHDLAGQFLEHRTSAAAEGQLALPPKPPAEPGTVEPAVPFKIGRYKILQKIGEGGCGLVYMAEQEEPVRRRIALKIVKPGMDTRQVVARFEAERQALALMDHPNIAKILDGGVTESGRPFFVMDLVQGLPITQFCDEAKLSTRARLTLFLEVCSAIQHAHQKGVIHRDIKPSNILVTLRPDGSGLPKVIDFGIAKATQQPLTDKTLFTQFQQLIGTPAYMSPEQATLTGFDIDTRSDIYSLGVLLYELLTGKTPFDSKELLQAGVDELRRTIREKEPPRPSTRVSTLAGEELTITAERRGVEASRLVSVLRGDLDWIVMKCLEKDRARRYETANGLAMDIQRHQNDEPVLASPPSALYRFQKLARRHKLAFAAVGAVMAALAIGVAVSTFEAVRARQAEREQSRLRIAAQKAEMSEASQKATAQQLLYDSLVGQARSTRLARRVGYRDKVLALLNQAKALDVPQKRLADLRQEAVASLGDFVGLTPTRLDFPSGQNNEAASLTPSGKLAAFAGYDRTMRLYTMPEGKEVARLPWTNGTVRASRFNATGDQLFAVAVSRNPAGSFSLPPPKDFRIRTWIYGWALDRDGLWRETRDDEVAGATRATFVTEAGVFDVTLEFEYTKPNDPSNYRARFRLLNLSTGAFVPGYELTSAASAAGDLNFCVSADGQFLAVEATDTHSPFDPPSVTLYRWRGGERIGQMRLPIGSRWGFGGDHPALNLFYRGAETLIFSDNGKWLFDLSGDGAGIYGVPGLDRLGQIKGEFWPHLIQAHGNLIALRTVHRLGISLLDMDTQKEVAYFDEPEGAAPAGFSEKGDALLTAGDRHASFFQLVTRERLDLPPHGAGVPGAAFSPDGLRLASVGKDRVMRVYDAITGRILWETNDLPGLGQCVSFSADGRLLAVGNFVSDLVWIRNSETGERLLELGDGQAGGSSVQFSPVGRYLATAVSSGIKIWRIERDNSRGSVGALKATLVRSWPGVGVGCVAFSPDGRLIAFFGNEHEKPMWTWRDRQLYFWDFQGTGQPRPLPLQPLGWVQNQTFTPDGRLITVEGQGNVTTLDATTGSVISSCMAEGVQSDFVDEVQASPDGTRLAIISPRSSEGGVAILDPKTGKLLYSLPVEANGYWLAWSPDSKRLAVSVGSGSISIWSLEAVNQVLAQLGLSP